MSQTDRYGGRWSKADLEAFATSAEETYSIPPGGLRALIAAESAWDINAVSPAGAEGLAQFMPPTSAEWEVDPWDPIDAINGAARYLAWLRSRVPTWSAALAAYNWGIGNVEKTLGDDGLLPLDRLPAETRKYVAKLAPAFGESPSGAPTAPVGAPLVALLGMLGLVWWLS